MSDTPTHPLFASHNLNPSGAIAVENLKRAFTKVLADVEAQLAPEVSGRELALVKTHLQTACMFAVRGVAIDPVYQP